MLLSDAIERYLTLRSAKFAKSTVRCDSNDLRRLLAGVGNIRLNKLTKDHIVSYFYGNRGRVNLVQASTFNAERARIKAFLDWCVAEDYLEKSPMRDIDRRRVGTRERVRLSREQMAELIEGETYPRDRALLALGANTGLRAHAITGLRVKDVDLGQGWLNTYTSKTDKQARLPITQELSVELMKWLTEYCRATGVAPHPDWYLVPARHRGIDGFRGPEKSVLKPTEQMGYHTALRIVHRALERLGMDHPGAGTHTLRRSAGRAVFDAGVEEGDARAIHVARELLGHAHVTQTEVYLGTSVERQALEDRMRGKSFLTRKVEPTDNVVSLAAHRRARG